MSWRSLGLQVHEARDQIGQHRRRGDALHGADQLALGLRQQLERLLGALPQLEGARLDLGRRPLVVGDQLDAGDQEGPALDESKMRKRCTPWQMTWCEPSGAVM